MDYTLKSYGLSLKGAEDPISFSCAGFSSDFPSLELPQSFSDVDDFSLFKRQYQPSVIYIADLIPSSISRCIYEQTPSLKRDFIGRFAELASVAHERGVDFVGMDFGLDSVLTSQESILLTRDLIKRCAASVYGTGMKINLIFNVPWDSSNFSEAMSIFMRDMMIPGVTCTPEYYLQDGIPSLSPSDYMRYLRYDISSLKLIIHSEDLITKNNILPWIEAMDKLKIGSPLIFQPVFSRDEVFFRAVEKIRKIIKGELL